MHTKAEIHHYHCTQAQLYTICRLGWRLFIKHINSFTEFKPMYTLAYAEERLAEIIYAEELPFEQARNAVHESKRVELIRIGKIALGNWRDLKQYIISAYDKEFLKPILQAAGSTHYRKASNQNWKEVNAMLTSGEQYIANHLSELTANNNMPPSFQQSFSEIKNEFSKCYSDFLDAEEEALLKTGAKLSANNAIHHHLMVMLKDAQAIFRRKKRMAKFFTFEYLLKLLSKPHEDASAVLR